MGFDVRIVVDNDHSITGCVDIEFDSVGTQLQRP
jgi:hypothetical protein